MRMDSNITGFLGRSFWAVVAIFIIQSCGGDSGSGPQKTAADYTEDGWAKFTTGDYAEAYTDFNQAISKDTTYADGYLGLGWSGLYLNTISWVRSKFYTGKSNTTDSAMIGDFHAGLAFVHLESGLYSQCIAAVDSCMALDVTYSFSRRTSTNYVDLTVAKAKAYFLLGGDSNLKTAAELVHAIIPEINLRPDVSSTWRVMGQQYNTFTEALVRALEDAAEIAHSDW